jgi:nucleoside-diphosphate-sugar epimerase
MSSALIGSTGFVGTSLLRQRVFDRHFHSANIDALANERYSLIVCAGAPAQKWIANHDPAADRARLESLLGALASVECERLVLISTVDVFANPIAVDENSPVDESGLHAYGKHRREIELLVERRFPEMLIVRLPGLVGPGLRKNAVYDFHNDNNLSAVDSRAVYQFYPMVRLWQDIEVALSAGLRLVHLTAEPVSAAEVSRAGFGREFRNELTGEPARYDFRSRHAALFGADGAYQYSKRESLLAVCSYAQSEARVPKKG